MSVRSSTPTAPPSPSDHMSLLAHQGGWDEILLVAGPVLVLAGLLWLANRRADQAAEEHKKADKN